MCGACLDDNGRSMYEYAISRESGMLIYNGARLGEYKSSYNSRLENIARYE